MFFETYRDLTVYRSAIGDNTCPAHFHRSAEIMYVLSGEKYVRVDEKEYLLREGDVLFCPPQAVHCFPPAQDSSQLVATVPAEYCRRFENFCETREPADHVLHDGDGSLKKLLFALTETENEILFEGIAGILLGKYVQKTKFFHRKKTESRSEIREIAEYIDKNFAFPITLSGLAANFGYSPNYFSSLFRKYFHTGIPQYVNAVRIQKSLGFLKTHTSSSVYFLCGFKSPQQYFLNFKKYFGCTPYEYLHAEKNRRFPTV